MRYPNHSIYFDGRDQICFLSFDSLDYFRRIIVRIFKGHITGVQRIGMHAIAELR